MSSRAKAIAVLKVVRAVGTVAMLGSVGAGAMGFGPEVSLLAGAGSVTIVAFVLKVTHFLP